jgi:hypothetical protein
MEMDANFLVSLSQIPMFQIVMTQMTHQIIFSENGVLLWYLGGKKNLVERDIHMDLGDWMREDLIERSLERVIGTLEVGPQQGLVME